MSGLTLKILGIIASVGGIALTGLSNWVGDKQQKIEIQKAVEEALKKQGASK